MAKKVEYIQNSTKRVRTGKAGTAKPKYLIEPYRKLPIMFVLSIFVDAWILMLVLGSLGHELNEPRLYQASLLVALLIILAVRSLIPYRNKTWALREYK